MISDSERRESAAWLRGEVGNGYHWPGLLRMAEAVGVPDPTGSGCEGRLLGRLADLIDPTCEVRRDALFYPETDLTPEHEETVYRCGSCGEIVIYDEDYDPETDLPTYCMRCGSRITGIGEPWDE